MGGTIWVESGSGATGSKFSFTAKFARSLDRSAGGGEGVGEERGDGDQGRVANGVGVVGVEGLGMGRGGGEGGGEACDSTERRNSGGAGGGESQELEKRGRVTDRGQAVSGREAMRITGGDSGSADYTHATPQQPLGPSEREQGTEGRGKVARRGEEGGLGGVNVLVADDCVVNQKVACAFLRKVGMVAEAVGDGQQVLERLEARPEFYHLLLLDVQVGGGLGLQLGVWLVGWWQGLRVWRTGSYWGLGAGGWAGADACTGWAGDREGSETKRKKGVQAAFPRHW